MPEKPTNVRIITLGCAKNEVDSEEIAGVLRSSGFHVDGRANQESVTIINTCGFLESAKKESIDAIKAAVRSKGKGKVIVAGCLAQRMGEDLMREAPGADAYVGVGQMQRFDHLVNMTLTAREPMIEIQPPHHRWAEVQSRARSGHPWSAYLKVSEGCDHRCTFCTIPSFRGGHQSKPMERVLEEARFLAQTGARELNLIAQDVTQYGYDLYREFTLPKLLRELNQIDEVRWLRILYFYPNRLTADVIDAMATCEKVVPYIDIPLQHAHPDVLRRMKRPWDGDRYLKLFEQVRAAIPEVCIRTTFIVGFPGETEAEFQHLLSFVKEAKLDRVGAFLFSREPGTPSYDMPDQIASRVKKDRYERLMRTQQIISRERNAQWVGRSIEVLVESHKEGWSIGRSFRDAPEIDGCVYVRGELPLGSYSRVNVTESNEYDLIGVPEGQPIPDRKSLTGLRMAPPKPPQ